MASIEDLREQLEALKTIDEESHKSLLEHIRQRKSLEAEVKTGKITLEEYNEVVESGVQGLSANAQEMMKLTEQMHKQAKAVDLAKKAYGMLNTVVDKTTGTFDALTGASTSNLTTMMGQAKAVGELGIKLQSLQVDLRRGTGFANRHTKAFDRLRDTYVDYGMTADDVAASLTSLSTKFSAFDSMSAASRDAMAKTAAEYKNAGVEFEDFAALNERLRFSFGKMGSGASLAAEKIKSIAQETGRPLSSVVSALNDIGPELGRFGSQGIKVFEGLAMRARSLGLGIKEAFDISELFDTFEGAANIAGRLNAQLGLQLNSVEIMRASSEERLDILRSEFQLQGKNFETMGRRQKQMVAGILGRSIEETAKVFGDGMDITAFRAEESTQDKLIKSQDKVAAAMQRLTENLPIVKAMGGMTGVIEMQGKAIDGLANNTKTLANALTGVAGVRAGVEAGSSLMDVGGSILSGITDIALLRSMRNRGGPKGPKGKGGIFSRIKSAVMGKKYKGGQMMPGGGRAPAGGARSGMFGKLMSAGGRFASSGIGRTLAFGAKRIPLIAGIAAAGAGVNALMKGDGFLNAVGSSADAIIPGASNMASYVSDKLGIGSSTPKGSPGVTPAMAAGAQAAMVIKEMTLPIKMVVDGREFSPIVEKAMNVRLNPTKPK